MYRVYTIRIYILFFWISIFFRSLLKMEQSYEQYYAFYHYVLNFYWFWTYCGFYVHIVHLKISTNYNSDNLVKFQSILGIFTFHATRWLKKFWEVVLCLGTSLMSDSSEMWSQSTFLWQFLIFKWMGYRKENFSRWNSVNDLILKFTAYRHKLFESYCVKLHEKLFLKFFWCLIILKLSQLLTEM